MFTTHTAAADLFDQALALGVEVVSHEAPSIRAALQYLTQSLGCATVSIEAGSSSSVEAYDEPCLVDEVMLSVFEDAIPDAVVGPDFLAPSRLEALFGPSPRPYRVDEPSGRWEFRRLTGG